MVAVVEIAAGIFLGIIACNRGNRFGCAIQINILPGHPVKLSIDSRHSHIPEKGGDTALKFDIHWPNAAIRSVLFRTAGAVYVKVYGWMTDQMQRNGKKVYANNTITVDCDDKLFWMCVDVDEQTGSILPQGYSRPLDIREAGSVSSLFGNMAMGIVNAKLFHITGETLYCERAVEIAKALTASSSYNINGCFLNDRDAWANGSFVGAWVKEVLTLDGITAAEIDMITNTAASIQKNCRTDKGYYRAEWLGGNAWTKATQSMATPTVPEQIMTTANTVHFIVAAGLAEAKNLF